MHDHGFYMQIIFEKGQFSDKRERKKESETETMCCRWRVDGISVCFMSGNYMKKAVPSGQS